MYTAHYILHPVSSHDLIVSDLSSFRVCHLRHLCVIFWNRLLPEVFVIMALCLILGLRDALFVSGDIPSSVIISFAVDTQH